MTTIMAHRGARNLWAENSLAGFRNAAALNVEAIEFDLHLGANGELLVIHDATLERTTTGTGPVRLLTTDSRHDVKLIGPSGPINEGVPLLEEVLDLLAPASNVRLFPEIKADEIGLYDPALLSTTVDMLRNYELASRTCLHSFDIQVLREIAHIAPEFERMISVNAHWMEKQGGIQNFFESIKGLVNLVSVEHEFLTAEHAQITKLFPLDQISVWTVNTPELLSYWLERGPRYIASDDARLALTLQRTEAIA
ncbi:glycerophosphodiester phosphodiesterase family protein [Sulfitobacter geojensis]|uniref:glycerophosphodiester phosphodiesterase family protein n=1 Tax=Sulfitobacter geojensis TaxID=1342299 RepID=UPI003B8C3079